MRLICNRTQNDAIWELISLFLTNQIAGNTIDFKMNVIKDGDPSQNSYAAKMALKGCDADLLSIPARSADINPIENLFHLVRRELDRQSLSGNITHETYEQFSSRLSKTFKLFPSESIDNIIESMDKRMGDKE